MTFDLFAHTIQDGCQTPSLSLFNEDDLDLDSTMGVDSNVAAAIQV